MEFGHVRGRRDGYYHQEDQEIDSSSNKIPSPSSEATTMTVATCSNIELKEHMFDKVVTPSDVGKLNRLVIPKQHAERHFPLDPSSNEKGLLLNFEDRTGKMWRFRYSYWNSSQSYVMTKGWSRFVKEKQLDAGDTVSFSRGASAESNSSNSTHLFIDWKRRPEAVVIEPPRLQPRIPFSMQPSYPMVSFSRPWGSSRLLVPNDPNATVYNLQNQRIVDYHRSGSVFRSMAPPVVQMQHQLPGRQVLDATLGISPTVLDSVPVPNSQQAAAKRVRLFGVNLDFQESDRSGAGTSQSNIFSSNSSSSPSPSRKEEQLSLDLDM